MSSATMISTSALVVLMAACSKPPPATCSDRDISSLIIQETRPLMGPREQEFWLDVIEDAATRHGNSFILSTSKIAQESAFKQHQVSSAGAKGPAQIMPFWLKSEFAECKDIDPFEIEASINCGAKILSHEMEKTKGDIKLALQFYNGGDKSAKNEKTKAYANEVLARAYIATLKCSRKEKTK